MWIRIEDDAASSVATALESKGFKELAVAIREEADAIETQERIDLIEAATDQYATGSDHDIEIDEDAAISDADNGTWVQAWVWIFDDDEENDQKD